MQEYWYRDIIFVLLIIVLLQFMAIYNLSSKPTTKFELCVPELLSPAASRSQEFINQNDSNLTVKPSNLAPLQLSGVAVTTFLGSPKWYQNRYSLMVNQMISILPDDWAVQIFYLPNNKMAIEGTNYPGIQKQVAKRKVILTPIPPPLAKLKKNELMLSPAVWEGMLAENILLFGGNSVLCANSPLNISSFVEEFDFIGTPWNEHKGVGGGNGLSLRKKSIVLEHLYAYQNSSAAISDNKKGRNKASVREDSYLVDALLKSNKTYRIAKRENTYPFAMTGNIAIDKPLGAVGTLPDLSDKMRQQYLDYCPELKMMFPSLHSPSCFGAEPNVLECFRYLCNDGGLKCNKVENKLSFKTKGDKVVIIEIKTEDD